ncbi:MAG: hypothetical protein OEM67_08925 [Thermoleophilia bacterium]|nr:hypothetical protein [Thermoleophilia bacterium]MDH3725422.1 hypothetical protein [Thermoleophilia bacterium]
MGRVANLLLADLTTLARRRWVLAAGAVGAALTLFFGLGDSGADYQRNVAAVLALGGLAVALGLGAPALVRDLESGVFGLFGGAGATASDIGWARLASRAIALVAVLVLWSIAAQVGSLVSGDGLDGDLALHSALTIEVLLLVLLAAAGAATLVGVAAGAIFGLVVFITAQAVVNLKAAADQGLIGNGASGLDLAYWLLPRAVVSPMLADLQAADEGGPVAPQVEINGNIVEVPAAELDTVLWTLAWCGLFLGLAIFGLRRREL